MTDTPPTSQDHGSTAADRLAGDIADIHVPEPSSDTEALLLKLGFALPVVGVVLVLLAWWEASGSKYIADQIPALISGGLFGLAMVVIGLGLFIRFSMARLLRFWSARLVLEQQAHTDRVVEALAGVEQAVRDAAAPAGADDR